MPVEMATHQLTRIHTTMNTETEDLSSQKRKWSRHRQRKGKIQKNWPLMIMVDNVSVLSIMARCVFRTCWKDLRTNKEKTMRTDTQLAKYFDRALQQNGESMLWVLARNCKPEGTGTVSILKLDSKAKICFFDKKFRLGLWWRVWRALRIRRCLATSKNAQAALKWRNFLYESNVRGCEAEEKYHSLPDSTSKRSRPTTRQGQERRRGQLHWTGILGFFWSDSAQSSSK